MDRDFLLIVTNQGLSRQLPVTVGHFSTSVPPHQDPSRWVLHPFPHKRHTSVDVTQMNPTLPSWGRGWKFGAHWVVGWGTTVGDLKGPWQERGGWWRWRTFTTSSWPCRHVMMSTADGPVPTFDAPQAHEWSAAYAHEFVRTSDNVWMCFVCISCYNVFKFKFNIFLIFVFCFVFQRHLWDANGGRLDRTAPTNGPWWRRRVAPHSRCDQLTYLAQGFLIVGGIKKSTN